MKTGPKNTKVTPEIRRLIKQTVRLTLNEMVDLIQEQHGVNLSDWTVSAVKREKLHRDQLELFSDDLLDSILHNEPENDASESKEVERVHDFFCQLLLCHWFVPFSPRDEKHSHLIKLGKQIRVILSLHLLELVVPVECHL